MTLIETIVESFREEYKKAYAGIFSAEVLAQGNEWFESFLRSSLQTIREKTLEEIENIGEQMKFGGRKLTLEESLLIVEIAQSLNPPLPKP